jgi:hypothetical protein
MDLAPLLLLGFMWLVVNALRNASKKPPTTPKPPAGRVPAPRPTSASRAAPPSRVAGPDATQREGLRLEDLLRELGRTLDQAQGPLGRAPDRRLPPAEEVEERGSLEVTPETRSLEADPQRGERAVVDRDDEAEQVVERRRAAAEATAAGLTQADHKVFDARIRQEPADKTATRGAFTTEQLRKAVVWREVLGPPVSLRREEDRW